MNTERAIIVHTEFVKQCVKVGRSVVEELREAIANKEEISDERIEELFTPLIDFVEKETDTRVARETDEIRAKFKYNEDLERREDAVNEIRSEIEEKFVINVNGKKKLCQDGPTTKRMRWAMASTKARAVFPELETAVATDAPPIKDPSKLIEDPLLLEKDSESKVWHDYCPQVNITIDSPGEELLTTDGKASLHYLEKKNIHMDTIEQYVPFYHAHQDTFNDHSTAADLKTVAKLCDNVLAGVKLTPPELYYLMGGDNYVFPEAVKAARRLLLHHYNCNK
jgi:hypothetical protein